MDLNHLIQEADRQDHSTGKKRWARQCEQHQQEIIQELELKEVERIYK